MAVTTDPSKTGISETDALALTGTTLAPNVVNASLNSITPTGGALRVDGRLGVNVNADSALQISGAGGSSLRIGFNDTSANFFDADTQNFRSGSGDTIVSLTTSGAAVTGAVSASGGIESLASVSVTKAGSDSIGSGPLMQVRNAGATRSWAQQLSASSNLDWWHLDGSWTKYMTLSTAGLAVTGYYAGTEQTAPSAPAADGYRIFAQDNGAGKTQLMVIFATGAAQQIAIEP